jgi:hypothetical protein
MKTIKRLMVSLIVGMVIGLWFGVNLGRGDQLLSNPFTQETLQKKIKKTGGEMLEMSGKIVEEQGKALQEELQN